MKNSKISWTNHSWNPVTGCTQVSPGCDLCYAKTLTEKYGRVFENVEVKPHKLNEPKKWKEPSFIFVNSMSDLFHRDIPSDYLCEIWQVMLDTPRHIYQVLTKRPHRMTMSIEKLGLELAPHIWLGVSVENQKFAENRIPEMLKLGHAVPWISAEPLLGPLDLSPWINDLQWVVTGGESGAGRRPMDYNWVRDIRDICIDTGTPLWYKQGNHFRPDNDNVLDGRMWTDYPEMAYTHLGITADITDYQQLLV